VPPPPNHCHSASHGDPALELLFARALAKGLEDNWSQVRYVKKKKKKKNAPFPAKNSPPAPLFFTHFLCNKNTPLRSFSTPKTRENAPQTIDYCLFFIFLLYKYFNFSSFCYNKNFNFHHFAI
jgi:hypothetical protein